MVSQVSSEVRFIGEFNVAEFTSELHVDVLKNTLSFHNRLPVDAVTKAAWGLMIILVQSRG